MQTLVPWWSHHGTDGRTMIIMSLCSYCDSSLRPSAGWGSFTTVMSTATLDSGVTVGSRLSPGAQREQFRQMNRSHCAHPPDECASWAPDRAGGVPATYCIRLQGQWAGGGERPAHTERSVCNWSNQITRQIMLTYVTGLCTRRSHPEHSLIEHDFRKKMSSCLSLAVPQNYPHISDSAHFGPCWFSVILSAFFQGSVLHSSLFITFITYVCVSTSPAIHKPPTESLHVSPAIAVFCLPFSPDVRHSPVVLADLWPLFVSYQWQTCMR